MVKVQIYDTTLREGAQSAECSFTVLEQIKIVKLLDDLKISYIEVSNPEDSPKAKEFFHRVRQQELKTAKLVAFGSTCHRKNRPEEDIHLAGLLSADTKAVCIYGKTWDLHATEVLGVSPEENLDMIFRSIRYLKEQGKEVFFDAEHFFDGYKHNRAYAMDALGRAMLAGADRIVLCDTNGGCFPNEIGAIVSAVQGEIDIPLGIHCHNDTGMADANSVAAVQNGATLVQSTLSGIGERCGNANLFVTLPNLQLKLGYDCIPQEKLKCLSSAFAQYNEIANIPHDASTPYVGRNAFAHKAGTHIDAMSKTKGACEHLAPELIGAKRKLVLSEMSGRMAVIERAREIDPTLTKDSEKTKEILELIKQLEAKGYQFEGAQASFELLVRRSLKMYQPFFCLKAFRATVEEPSLDGRNAASAMVEVQVGKDWEVAAGLGNGPVNALDNAARKALERFYPCLKQMHLTDFKVRVLDSSNATASEVRVTIESRDEHATWRTVGVSADIINASWIALMDSLEYKLLKDDCHNCNVV